MSNLAAIHTSQKRETTGGGAPFAAGSADNGLSVDPVTGRIVLGNDVGGSSAALLSNREIPLDLNQLAFRGVPYNADFHRVIITDNAVTINGENDSGFGSFFNLNDLNTGINGSLSNGGAGITLLSDGNINITALNSGSVSISAAGDSNGSIQLNAPTATSGADIEQVTINSAFNTAGRPAMMGFDLNPISQAAGSEFIRFSINGTELMGIDLAGDIQKFTVPFFVYADGLAGAKIENIVGTIVSALGDVNGFGGHTHVIVDDGSQFVEVSASSGLTVVDFGVTANATLSQNGLAFADTGSSVNYVGAANQARITATNGLLLTGSTTLIRTGTTLSNNAGAALGTITNAPTAGNPAKWIAIIDNGVTRFIPTWI